MPLPSLELWKQGHTNSSELFFFLQLSAVPVQGLWKTIWLIGSVLKFGRSDYYKRTNFFILNVFKFYEVTSVWKPK